MLQALWLVVNRTFLAGAAVVGGLGGSVGVSVSRAPLTRSQQREVIRRVRLDRPRLGPTFLCVRLPASGYPVIMVMRTRTTESLARQFLQEIRVDGRVEVSTIGGQNDASYRLSEALRRAIPATYHGVQIFQALYNNGYTGRVTCPKVYIEVGPRHGVAAAVIRWAQAEVRHLGADRVAWRYSLPLEPAGPR